MKRSENYVLRNLDDETFLIPRGKMAERISGVLTLSETASFIYGHVEEVKNPEELVNMLSKEYHATEEEKKEMKADVQEVLRYFREYGIIEEAR